MINKLVNTRPLEEESSPKNVARFPVILFLLPGMLVLALGLGLGYLDSLSISTAMLAVLSMTLVILFRRDELTVALIIATHLYVDWYLGLQLVALVLTPLLLLILFLDRSSQRIWTIPHTYGLWFVLLGLSIFPALRGYSLKDGGVYYLTVFLAAFLFFWLGIVVAQNISNVRLVLKFLAALSALIALHTLIQSTTGIVLFASTNATQHLEQVSNYQLSAANGIIRAGSFFINPDWSGTFFAMVLFLPIGLFFESSQPREKILYGVEIFLIFLALLASYSTGAWIASLVALVIFLMLFGNVRSRLLLFAGFLLVIGALVVFFPAQFSSQLRHVTSAGSFPIRFAAWQTAIRVIRAFPFTGIGLGLYAYLYRAEPFRVAAQYMKLAHPHNAYLEIGTMAGLPVLLIFLLLLLVALWRAVHNWKLADARTRSLFAGSIAALVALSINSISINGWTLAPLASLGWLILGMSSSPSIRKSLQEVITRSGKKEAFSSDEKN